MNRFKYSARRVKYRVLLFFYSIILFDPFISTVKSRYVIII